MTTPEKGRERPTNYIQISNTIADSYPFGLTHGLQKDAIQNSVDAKHGNAPTKVEFNVVQNEKGAFLTITDQNTTGLTGDVKLNVEDYEELQKNDHWARFESFAFTKEDDDALGARGQGKFIFLCASREYKMLHDTLRGDGVYRLGKTQASKTGCPIYPGRDEEPWENDVAEDQLLRQCGLTPLSEIGTRVIICSPRGEVTDAINSGEMEEAIQETWFRLLQKKRLEVTIRDKGKARAVKLPQIYELPQQDSKSHKVWALGDDFEDDEIKLPSGQKYRVKHFHAAYLKRKTVPESIRGVALVQGGMKITSPRLTLPLPPNIAEKIIGYIEFDRKLDRELRKGGNQHPNHYDLKWRASVPRAIRKFISEQLNAFGKGKLGLSNDPRKQKNTRRNNAEEFAMQQLQRYAKDLNLLGRRGGGSVKEPKPGSGAPSHKEKGLILKELQIPDDGRRVNWGEQITFSVWAFNRLEESIRCKISLRVLHGDSEIVKLLDHEPLILEPDKREQVNGAFVLHIKKSMYKNIGEHRIKAVLIDAATGEEIDAQTRKFWVESNPPMRQPFNLQPNPRDEKRAWWAHVDDMTLYYNTRHPEYLDVEDDEEKQADYLFRICLEGAMSFVLQRASASADDKPDYAPLNTGRIARKARDEVPNATYDEIMDYISKIRWQFYKRRA